LPSGIRWLITLSNFSQISPLIWSKDMADTRCQTECESWIRDVWLPAHFNQSFYERKVRLASGGEFMFDAVSADGTIVVSISTSRAAMSNGKPGVGKQMKLRGDMLFHHLAIAPRHIMAFTEACMYEWSLAEKRKGRVPTEIELILVELPSTLAERLAISRERSSKEVRARTL
jgi:hypothetical protein